MRVKEWLILFLARLQLHSASSEPMITWIQAWTIEHSVLPTLLLELLRKAKYTRKHMAWPSPFGCSALAANSRPCVALFQKADHQVPGELHRFGGMRPEPTWLFAERTANPTDVLMCLHFDIPMAAYLQGRVNSLLQDWMQIRVQLREPD